jgi:hypothetical protein
MAAISRTRVGVIMCAGGTKSPFVHDRHFSAASGG